MSSKNNEINRLKQENKLLREKIEEIERSSLILTQIQYLFHKLIHNKDIDNFLTLIMQNIQSIAGGKLSLILNIANSWEAFVFEENEGKWRNLTTKEIKFYKRLPLGENHFIYPSNLLQGYQDKDQVIQDFYPIPNIQNLVLMLIENDPIIYLEIRNFNSPNEPNSFLPRYFIEIEEFFIPLNFSFQQALLIDQSVKALQQTGFLLDLLFHDIRNYISTTLLSLEIMEKYGEKDNETFYQPYKIANKQMIQATTLINRIEKILLTENQNNIEAVILNDAIEEVFENIIDQFHERSPVLYLNEDSIPQTVAVLADELLPEIIYNLVTNAIKYTEEEPPRVEVFWKPWEEDLAFLRIQIKDWGIGIPDENKLRILGRFQVVSPKGLGLGLNVVLRIVERYNGHIWFENRVEDDYTKGTVANVCLKLKTTSL